MVDFINIFHILTCGNDKSHRIDRWLQLVDISKLGLNSKIKKFSYSFICGKGYSPPFGGRIAFYLQSKALCAALSFPVMVKKAHEKP